MAEILGDAHDDRPAYSYAFQPIVDTLAGEIYSHEALIRGARGESAASVFALVQPEQLAAFDRESRAVAVGVAGRLGIASQLNLNATPGSLQASESALRSLTDAATHSNVPLDRLILEVTEREAIDDHAQFADLLDCYRALGIKVAIDDMGAGHSGLNLLADVQPEMIKLDINLVRSIESRGPRQSIVRAIVMVCADLGIDIVAEGVETPDELRWLEAEGIRLFQGYFFARPAFEQLLSFSELRTAR